MSTYSTPGKAALVCGAGGFIGHHLVKRLKREGFWVRGTDLKFPRFSETEADDFVIGDLRDPHFVRSVIDRRFNEIYQLAADMGGAGYIFTGENDADVMHNSASINLNVLHAAYTRQNRRIFYSSSACMYPEHNQLDPDNPNCAEDSAYPAAPDSEYGWEKLFSERLYLAYGRNHGMEVRIARYHNIFGPEGSWNDGKEKAPAAVCRKVAAGAEWGRDRNLGRRQADAVVSVYRRMPRRHAAAHAFGFHRSRQHRFRRNGHHRPAGRHGGRYRRQDDQQAPYRRSDRSARPQFRQSTDSGKSSAGRLRRFSATACGPLTNGSMPR